MNGDLRRVDRFVRTLELALGDIEAEEKAARPVSIFLDADVVISAVLGLTAWDEGDLPSVRPWRFVVQSLLTTGFLPKVRLTTPHLLEFDRFIQRTADPMTAMERGFKVRHMRRLARAWGLDEHDRHFREAEGDPEAIRALIENEGVSLFVKLELCYGGFPRDRLFRVMRHVEFHRPQSLSNASPHAAAFLPMIEAHRSAEANEERDINNRVDALALGEIVARAHDGQLPRLYSETPAIKELSESDRLRDPTGNTLLRGPGYFLMRASFPALHFVVGEPPEVSSEADYSLQDLQELRDQLTEIRDEGPPTAELDRILRERKLSDGRSVKDVISDFYRLRFLARTLDDWGLPRIIQADLVPFVQSFFADTSLVFKVRKELLRSFRRARDLLSEEVGYLRDWNRDYVILLDRLERSSKRWGRRLPDPWRDLGLGRWGVVAGVNQEVQQELLQWIEGVRDAYDLGEMASRLAIIVAEKTYEGSIQFELTLLKLWAIHAEELLVREWDEGELLGLTEGVWSPLKILSLVSRIKSMNRSVHEAGPLLRHEMEEVVRDARSLVEEYSSREGVEAAAAAMGLAHVLYWGWQELAKSDDSGAAHSWASESFEAGLRAKAILEGLGMKSSLMWVFAVNHSAYLGLRAAINPDLTEELLQDLEEVHPSQYHYRVADTQAREFTEQVLARVRSDGIRALRRDPQASAQLCRYLEEAVHILMDGRPFFGDIEIQRHWRTLSRLHMKLRCAFSLPSLGAELRTAMSDPATAPMADR